MCAYLFTWLCQPNLPLLYQSIIMQFQLILEWQSHFTQAPQLRLHTLLKLECIHAPPSGNLPMRVCVCVWESETVEQNKARSYLMSDEKTKHTCRYFRVARCLTSGTMNANSSLWFWIQEPKVIDFSKAHTFPRGFVWLFEEPFQIISSDCLFWKWSDLCGLVVIPRREPAPCLLLHTQKQIWGQSFHKLLIMLGLRNRWSPLSHIPTRSTRTYCL